MLDLDPKSLPSATGVYLFLQGKTPLYIGKAVNLRARIKSHWRGLAVDRKERLIIQNCDRIKTVVTDSEFRALLLEAALIRKHKPKYNVVWKDGKSPLYIKITIADQYPKIFTVRRENDQKSLYFGPFNSSRTVSQLLREIRKIIPYCTQKNTERKTCFYSKIDLCSPCPAGIENIADLRFQPSMRRQYLANIRKIITLLKGRSSSVLTFLTGSMNQYRQQEDYENALILRNKITFLRHLIWQRSFADCNLTDSADLRRSLSQLHQEFFDFRNRYFGIKKINPPIKIECFDISHLFGDQATGSMVVFKDASPSKKDYRRFKIKTVRHISDTAAIREVIGRRLRRKEWPYPDLFIVDGGRPQAAILAAVLKEHKLTIPFVGFAKNPDRIIIGKQLQTIYLPANSSFFRLLQRVRDESHRFAKKYHLFLRKKLKFPQV